MYWIQNPERKVTYACEIKMYTQKKFNSFLFCNKSAQDLVQVLVQNLLLQSLLCVPTP